MIGQTELAEYWSDARRHSFVRPSFDVRVNEYDRRSGKFISMHTVCVNAWTHEAAKPAALKWLRVVMTGKDLGALQVVEVTYSQPVSWDVAGAAT